MYLDREVIEQGPLPAGFFHRIESRRERALLDTVIDTFRTNAMQYFDSASPEVDAYDRRFTRPWVEDDTRGFPFFHVYGIGSMVTHWGVPPDIDVLLVTNTHSPGESPDTEVSLLSQMPPQSARDPFLQRLWTLTQMDFGWEEMSEMPTNYNVGVTGAKMLLRLTPKAESVRPMDISYVQLPDPNKAEENLERYFFTTPEQFVALDVDEEGRPLEREMLYTCHSQDIGELVGDGGPRLYAKLNGKKEQVR